MQPLGGIFLTTLASMVLGGLWYGPFFGKLWARQLGMRLDSIPKPQAIQAMLATVGTSFVENFAFAWVLILVQATSALDGVSVGLLLGIGIVAMQMTSTVFFERKSGKLWQINASYRVVMMAINGAILGAMM